MWQEEKHPRDNEGKFTDGEKELSSMSAAELKKRQAQEIYDDERMPEKQSTDLTDLLGEEFKGYKGQSAIDKLLKEKRGHIKGAFHRDDIGDIDLLWGNENGGLLHVIKKRDKLLAKGVGKISGLDMVHKIPSIIDKGELTSDMKGRINIDYENYRVGILPTIYNKKVNWVVTAMEKFK